MHRFRWFTTLRHVAGYLAQVGCTTLLLVVECALVIAISTYVCLTDICLLLSRATIDVIPRAQNEWVQRSSSVLQSQRVTQYVKEKNSITGSVLLLVKLKLCVGLLDVALVALLNVRR